MNSDVSAIILAGGFGTRLQTVVSDVPKPMAPVAGSPFLKYILDYVNHYGIQQAVLSVGHKADSIENYFHHRYREVSIEYAKEEHPLGTGGAIRFAMEKVSAATVLVLNGDSFFEVDLNAVLRVHRDSGSPCTIVLRSMSKPDRYGTVTISSDNKLLRFNEKKQGLKSGLINTGIYVMNTDLLKEYKSGTPFSVEQDFFSRMGGTGMISAFVSEGYFIDIGMPEDYHRAQEEFKRFKFV